MLRHSPATRHYGCPMMMMISIKFINLIRSRDCICFYVCMCVYVSSSLHLLLFGSCFAVDINALSIIILKVYIERNNMQVELIRFRKKYRLYSRLCL